ncbi:MAG: prepilin-type N-terminal cleavage/methylation domain-containing protein [Nitrospiraceae bacterium]|nr:prepilin-type N-terminal cleavage/methylation domain-containing protein [Nitrospiraceae bacterium]
MTRISTTGKCSKGFTFLELVVVLFIISLFFTLAVPAFRRNYAQTDALKVASVLRELNDSSVAMKKNFDITFDMDAGKISWTGPEGKKSMDVKGLTQVAIPSRGAVKEGSLKVLFGPMGAPENIDVYMKGKGALWRVSLNELSGRVKVSSIEKK